MSYLILLHFPIKSNGNQGLRAKFGFCHKKEFVNSATITIDLSIGLFDSAEDKKSTLFSKRGF